MPTGQWSDPNCFGKMNAFSNFGIRGLDTKQ